MSKIYGELNGEVWLIHNQGGIELAVVRGPYRTEKDWKDALIDYVAESDYSSEEDTMHALAFDEDGPCISDFSGGFMDAVMVLSNPDDESDDDARTARKVVFGK